MRKVNYWKTLLVVLCTGCIFAACGDDDDENPFTGVDNNFLSFSLESNENVWKATIIDNEIGSRRNFARWRASQLYP